MRLDASAVAEGSVLEYDLCVIGAGPAGLAIASELVADGRRIVILDGASGSGSVLAGENTGYPYHPLTNARARGAGGSSRLWFPADARAAWPVDGGLRCRELDPIDFEQRPGVPHSGWPIRADELGPYYQRARALCGLDAEPGPVEPRGALARFAPGSGTAFELTTCEFAPRDRYFALAAEIERSETVTVLGGASATEISVGPAGRAVERVTVISGDGRRRFAVAARQFVLAAGGIENARLLLVSRSQHVDGIGNASGHVGRWFQEHIHVDIGHLWPPRRGWTEELRFFRRMAGAGGTGIIGGLRPRDEVQQAEGLLNSEVALVPRAAAFTPVSVRAAAELAWGVRHRSLPLGTPWRLRKVARHPGAVAKAALRRTIPAPGALTAAALVLTTEQAPNPRSRVALSTRRDAYGVPQPKLEWRFTTLDQASLRRTTALVGNTMAEAGLGRVEPLIGERWGFPRLYGCWHHMGTTRMSAHERDGVVDERCRVHGMENLYVAGSSVFPTGGATTVTLSLVALALRLADELQLA